MGPDLAEIINRVEEAKRPAPLARVCAQGASNYPRRDVYFVKMALSLSPSLWRVSSQRRSRGSDKLYDERSAKRENENKACDESGGVCVLL